MIRPVTDNEIMELERLANLPEPPVSKLSPNKLLTRYLMSSYLYYERDVNVLSDAEFDEVCYRLRDRFSEVDHPHKYLVDVGQLDAGTGFYLKYPLMVQQAAWDWYLRKGRNNASQV